MFIRWWRLLRRLASVDVQLLEKAFLLLEPLIHAGKLTSMRVFFSSDQVTRLRGLSGPLPLKCRGCWSRSKALKAAEVKHLWEDKQHWEPWRNNCSRCLESFYLFISDHIWDHWFPLLNVKNERFFRQVSPGEGLFRCSWSKHVEMRLSKFESEQETSLSD